MSNMTGNTQRIHSEPHQVWVCCVSLRLRAQPAFQQVLKREITNPFELIHAVDWLSPKTEMTQKSYSVVAV